MNPAPRRRRPPRRAAGRAPLARRFVVSRLWSLVAAAAAMVALFAGSLVPAAADPTPPTNPSDAQIGAAQASKDALATQVGSLNAQLVSLKAQVESLHAAAELAEQDYAYKVQQLQDAQAAAAAAKQQVASAQAEVDHARQAYNQAVRANFVDSSVQGGAGGLLTSSDPSQLLQSAAFQTYVTTHQADGIGRLDRATVAKANADATARAAVDAQTALTAAAKQAFADAQAAETLAQQRQVALDAQTVSVQAQLDTAQAALLGLQNQRAAYDAWKAEQARIAAEAERQRQAAILAQQQAAAAAAAAQNHSGGSGGGSGGGGGSSGGAAPAPSNAAADAVARALKWLGTRYSFAGGNYNGPSYGYCDSGTAGWNDCHVYGFDCSGLMMYAWAPYIHLAHKASIQYNQAGSFHPSVGQLQPGDMLFYSTNGTVAGIHHVAMYIGGGMVVQAPQSGDVVKKTSIWNMGSDYYGATRPLS